MPQAFAMICMPAQVIDCCSDLTWLAVESDGFTPRLIMPLFQLARRSAALDDLEISGFVNGMRNAKTAGDVSSNVRWLEPALGYFALDLPPSLHIRMLSPTPPPILFHCPALPISALW
jgi:hypothetical protein